MATVPTSPRTTDPAASRRPWRHIGARVGRAGVLGAGTGAALLYGYGTLVAALGVPMRAGDPWAAMAESVTPANFAIGVAVCTFWGTLLALGLGRWAARPARLFVRTTAALVVMSLAVPLAAVDTAGSTRVALALAHLLAAAVVVPIIARALRSAAPRR